MLNKYLLCYDLRRPQYLALATDRAGEALYAESCCLQQAAYGALGAVGGEDSSGAHGLVGAMFLFLYYNRAFYV